MHFQKVIFLDEDLASRLAMYCSEQPPVGEIWMGEDDTFSITVTFPNQFTMDLKVCGVKREEGADNTAWTEAILFDAFGRQAAVSDVGDTLEDIWELTDVHSNTYSVEVRRESTPAEICKYLHSLGGIWQMEDHAGYRVATLQTHLTKGGKR